MKKISTVLLVLVLVGSVAFAGFTGSASAGFGYNLDTQEYGFIGNNTKVSVDLNFLEAIGEAKAEGEVYADIKASLTFSFNNSSESGLDPNGTGTPLVSWNAATEVWTTPMIAALDFDHAKIVGDGWYLGILGTVHSANFATSAIDSTDAIPEADNALGFETDDSVQYADLRPRDYVTKNGSGVEFGMKDYVVSFGATGDVDGKAAVGAIGAQPAKAFHYFGTVTTPAYELADGVTAQFGAAVSTYKYNFDSTAKTYTLSGRAASGSAKVMYASDELSGSVAADVVYKGGLKADVAANVAYDAYSLDVYYATDAYRGGYKASPIKNLLSAKVVAAIDPVTVTLTGKNLVNAQALSASVDFAATEELAVTVKGEYTITGGAWNVGGSATYTTEDYVATAGTTYKSTTQVSLNASIASKTLIPGAEVKLAYAGDDLTSANATLFGDEDNGDKGKVLASVKIAF
ncbi:MAG: hypothetical protein EOM67_08405 [Spirochaetia bacterium]|nr:hypothetical protein [Spirochaetia bacterium]